MDARILPVLAVGLLLAACGGGGGEDKADSSGGSASSATPKKANGPTDTPDPEGSAGKMIVTYDEATTPEAQNGKKSYCRTTKFSKTSPTTSTNR